jgi:elongation factor 1 alpha-like protein
MDPGLKSGKAQANKDKTVGDLAKDLNKAKIDDTPRAKSKNLDVIAEYDKSEKKNAANFVVIGE